MGRTRAFDLDQAIGAARDRFVRSGYLGTSVDDLIEATGVPRSSLYHAFGSKRGLFLAALRPGTGSPDLDLVLVALMDLARGDDEVRGLAEAALGAVADPDRVLGERMLRRGRIGERTRA